MDSTSRWMTKSFPYAILRDLLRYALQVCSGLLSCAEFWLQEVNGDVPDRPASYWSHRSEMEDNAHAKCNFAGKAVKHFAMMLGPSRRSERLAIKKHI